MVSYSFADSEKYQECLVDGHEFEYLQSNRIDRSTREEEFLCVRCNITIQEYSEIPRQQWLLEEEGN